MNAVVYYSNTGQSASVATYLSKQLGYPLSAIERVDAFCYENLVLVFPVHCQNIPDIVVQFLRKVKVRYFTAIATYGKMCCGNVLYEIAHKFHMNLVAGAYIPLNHAYLNQDDPFRDFHRLVPIVEKIMKPSPIVIPKLYKNPFADLFPGVRSRMGIKIRKKSNCNNCGICDMICPFKAIRCGVTDGRCIRCLKCVRTCPRQALEFKLRLPLKLYLQKKPMNQIIIYI